MSEGIGAWLLQLNDSRSVATSEQEVIEYLGHPQLFPIPFTPEHCSSIVQWRDRLLPVIDICPLFGDQPDDEAQGIVVLAYQQASKLEYLALAVSQPPTHLRVSDDQVCESSELDESEIWATSELVLAVLIEDDQKIPVIDVPHLATIEFLRSAICIMAAQAVPDPEITQIREQIPEQPDSSPDSVVDDALKAQES